MNQMKNIAVSQTRLETVIILHLNKNDLDLE